MISFVEQEAEAIVLIDGVDDIVDVFRRLDLFLDACFEGFIFLRVASCKIFCSFFSLVFID